MLASGLKDELLLNFVQIYTVSQDGALFVWRYDSAPDAMDDLDTREADTLPRQWKISGRHYFKQSNAKVKSAAYHLQSNLLVVGFSNGIFGLYELPEFNMIHTLRLMERNDQWNGKELTS